MGTLQAQEMASMVDDGYGSLRGALKWHLSVNHYPSLPSSMIPFAEKAINYANGGEWNEILTLPEGITRRDGSNTMTVEEAVGSMHLEWFLESWD